MNIAILGATSFLARHCIEELLKKGHKLILFSRKPDIDMYNRSDNITWKLLNNLNLGVEGCINELSGSDVIINCLGAGIQPKHTDGIKEVWEVNAFFPIRMIEVLTEQKFKGMLFTFGSYFEMGEVKVEHIFNEDEFVKNSASLPNTYCLSKKTLTDYIANKHISGVTFTHLHCILTNIYGSDENSERLIPYIFRQVIKGMPMQFSSGNQQRQYTHIDDVASWLAQVISKVDVTTGIYNVTDETVVSVKVIVDKVLIFLEDKGYDISKVTFDELTKRDDTMLFLGLNSMKARVLLNWNPEIMLEKGIAEYYEQYR